MNIYVIGTRGVPGLQGGVEKHCEQLYPLLVEKGCAVTVFARTPYFCKEKRLTQWRGIELRYLWTIRQKHLEAIIHSFLAVFVSIIRKPDIVCIHNIGPAIWSPLLKLFGIKTVLTYHSANYEHQKWGAVAKKVLRFAEWVSVRCTDGIICVSQDTQRRISDKYPDKKIDAIPNGVAVCEMIQPPESILERYGLNRKQFVLVVGRFTPEKGIYDILCAFEGLKENSYKLVIVGESDYDCKYSRKIKDKARNISHVILTGMLSHEDLIPLYATAALFVIPSYNEGFPLVLLEALVNGCPVLASEVLKDKGIPLRDYRYFHTGDIAHLTEKMAELLRQDIDSSESVRYKDFVRSHFDWNDIAEKTVRFYHEVASGQ